MKDRGQSVGTNSRIRDLLAMRSLPLKSRGSTVETKAREDIKDIFKRRVFGQFEHHDACVLLWGKTQRVGEIEVQSDETSVFQMAYFKKMKVIGSAEVLACNGLHVVPAADEKVATTAPKVLIKFQFQAKAST